jgi:hypothetical protein
MTVQDHPANRCLDAWVAELVMGWKNVRDADEYGHWTGGAPDGYEDNFSCAAHCEGELPYYSEDINAAMEVLCKARGEPPGDFLIGPVARLAPDGPVMPGDYFCWIVHPKFRATGASISEVVCRAALLAA